MKKIIIGITISFVLVAAVVHAQSAMTGKWEGETRSGTQIVLDLTAKQAALTGTLNRNGEAILITEGKVSKNTLTFKAKLGDQTDGFTGELVGDQITIWIDRLGRESTAILKRIKK